jgi:hypothetical protein
MLRSHDIQWSMAFSFIGLAALLCIINCIKFISILPNILVAILTTLGTVSAFKLNI